MLRVLSLFSGIGAFEKALERLDIPHEVVNFCEIDRWASLAYSLIHGISEKKNLGDVMKVDEKALEDFDLMTWGFLCQDISIAGNQKGIVQGETRSGLYYEGLRILAEKRPAYSIIENVEAFTHKKFKGIFNRVLLDLAELGYKNFWKVLNAKDYGAPQNRERVFIVSIRSDIDHGFEFPVGSDSGIRLKDVLEKIVDEKYFLSERTLNYLFEHDSKHKAKGNGFHADIQRIDSEGNATSLMQTPYKNTSTYILDQVPSAREPGITRTLSARYYKDGSEILVSDGRNEINVIGQVDMKGNESIRRIYGEDGISPTVTTGQGGHRMPKVITAGIISDKERPAGNYLPYERVVDPEGIARAVSCHESQHPKLKIREATKQGYAEAGEVDSVNFALPNSKTRRGRVSPIANTLDTGCQQGVVTSEYRIRRLTPLECFRLMGFDDLDYTILKDTGISDTQLYKMAGNSIVVNVLEAIFKNLLIEHAAGVPSFAQIALWEV